MVARVHTLRIKCPLLVQSLPRILVVEGPVHWPAFGIDLGEVKTEDHFLNELLCFDVCRSVNWMGVSGGSDHMDSDIWHSDCPHSWLFLCQTSLAPIRASPHTAGTCLRLARDSPDGSGAWDDVCNESRDRCSRWGLNTRGICVCVCLQR